MHRDPIGRYLKRNPEDSQSRIAIRNGLAPSIVCDVRKGRKPGFTEAACVRIAVDLAGKPGAPSKEELMAYRKRRPRESAARQES